MRASAMVLALLLAAGTAAAQEQPAQPAPTPDFSKDSLLRLLTKDTAPKPVDERQVRYDIGAVTFTALGTRWRFIYLPIMMPLSGTRFRVSKDWPDGFELTGTSIATTPRSFRTRREMNRELLRIEQLEKGKIGVKVKVNGRND